MKVVAKPIGLPSAHELTKENLAKSLIGKKTIELIEEGIKKKFLTYKNIDECLKKFQTQMQLGTCYGQASSAIIADHHTQDMGGKALAEQASMVDAIGYQMLSNLTSLLDATLQVKIFLKKIQEDLEDAGKKTAKKLKKEKKAVHNEIKAADKTLGLPIKKISTEAIPQVELFRKKVSSVAQAALEEQSGYKKSGTEYITSDKKHKFIRCIKKLQKEKQDVALRVTLSFSCSNVAHTVALFPNHRFAIYDSVYGVTEASSKEGFVKAAKKLYDFYFHHNTGSIKMEILKTQV